MSWFLACWYKFRKVNSYFDNYWVGLVKNGWGVIDHWTLKSGVSHKWFDDLSRLTEWLLEWNNVGLVTNLLNLWQSWGILQKWSYNRFLFYFEKFCHWFLLEIYFKDWYYSEFNLMGHDLGFMTRFLNFHDWTLLSQTLMITVRNKNQWI